MTPRLEGDGSAESLALLRSGRPREPLGRAAESLAVLRSALEREPFRRAACALRQVSRRRIVNTGLCAALAVGIGILFGSSPAQAQLLSQRGFAEGRLTLFPQDAPADPVNAVADLVLREEVFIKPAPWIRFAAGADLRANSHDQVEPAWRVDLLDRRRLRPAISVRRLAATLSHGPFTLDLGRQFIRWGKTDIVTPTDRFAPRDFLNVVDSDFLGVTGARGVLQVGPHTLDVVWVPLFTPSRLPILNQRWAPAPVAPGPLTLNDAGAVVPDRSQIGVRYGRIAERVEYSVSVFDGFNHLPNIDAVIERPGSVDLIRLYPSMRSYGADAAVPTRWFTVKAEAAYSTSDTPRTDDFVLYVVQVERQSGEWVFVGGYAGEVVTARRAALTFAPDRGLTRSIVGRASYAIDPIRTLTMESAVRQDGGGVYVKAEYSQARGEHWRATAAGVAIAGRGDDFLGQYHRNSHVAVTLRYSF
jgi:hypothetical protein